MLWTPITTAIVEVAAESLNLRQGSGTPDRVWHALTTLAEDLINHIWDVQ